MPRIFEMDDSLTNVSPEIARKLVDRLYCQTLPVVIGISVFMMLGILGYLATGSHWYVAGFGVGAVLCSWRLWESRLYQRRRDSRSPAWWLGHFRWGAFSTAAYYGAWSVVVLHESNPAITIMAISAQSACVIGTAVRNCTARTVATVQVFVILTPLYLVCLVAGDMWLRFFGVFVALHLLAALSFCRFLEAQTLTLLRQDEEKSDLLVKLEESRQDLEVINQHLQTLAATDALTGIANRRAFDLASAREWRRSARAFAPMAMLLLDIDYFKSFNDIRGHQAGDECLREVAAIIGSVPRRTEDHLARYGGEEFAVILPETDLKGAVAVADRIRATLTEKGITHPGSPFGYVTVSIGAASMIGDPKVGVQQLTGMVDAALYAAKRGGRNQVRTADSLPLSVAPPPAVSSPAVPLAPVSVPRPGMVLAAG